ncbi:hypothetical protein BDZ45DRAFT_728246 [Acephala macrosclerotiorum]|nr:hypothetical protein BDZ45DRAFT_728246 [Acephala macrosclerotiorum]
MASSGDGGYRPYRPPRDQPTPQGNAPNSTYNLGVYNLANSVQPSLGNSNSFGPYSTQFGPPQVPGSYGYPAGAYGQAGQDYRYEATPQLTSQYPREPSQNFSSYGANTSPVPATSQGEGSGPEYQSVERGGTGSTPQFTSIEMCAENGSTNPWKVFKATRDTATTLNWITRKTVKRLHLKITGGLIQECETFNGQILKSTEMVTATWAVSGGPKSYVNEFSIVDEGPFDVLFGNNFLSAHSKILDGVADPACVLAQGKVKRTEKKDIEEKRESVEEESARLEDNRTREESNGSSKASSSSHRKSGNGSKSGSRRKDGKKK